MEGSMQNFAADYERQEKEISELRSQNFAFRERNVVLENEVHRLQNILAQHGISDVPEDSFVEETFVTSAVMSKEDVQPTGVPGTDDGELEKSVETLKLNNWVLFKEREEKVGKYAHAKEKVEEIRKSKNNYKLENDMLKKIIADLERRLQG